MTFVPKSNLRNKLLIAVGFLLIASLDILANSESAAVSPFGVLRGVVSDSSGRPIEGALISVSRSDSQRILKQTKSSEDGSFLTKLLPGTYSFVTFADGFETLSTALVQVSRSSESVYKIKLDSSEKQKADSPRRQKKSDSKWVIRAAQNRRSIFQWNEGEHGALSDLNEKEYDYDYDRSAVARFGSGLNRKASILQIVGGPSENQSFNFASLHSFSNNLEILVTGQVSRGDTGFARLDTALFLSPSENNKLTIRSEVSHRSLRASMPGDHRLSLSVANELTFSEGTTLILGFENGFSSRSGGVFFVPTIGLKTGFGGNTFLKAGFSRVRGSKEAIQYLDQLEGRTFIFFDAASEPYPVSPTLTVSESLLEDTNRLELSVERILNEVSAIEGGIFVDLMSRNEFPPEGISGSTTRGGISNSIPSSKPGFKLVYRRNFSPSFSGSLGFSNSSYQTTEGNSNSFSPSKRRDFQNVFTKLDANLGEGTQISTVLRLSSATRLVMVDPFQNQIMIHDPGLSVIVTRSLPNLGMPFNAQASIDARNITELLQSVNSEESSGRHGIRKGSLRGSLLLRF